MLRRVTLLVGTALLGACWPGWDTVHEEHLTGPYHLFAADLHEGMTLLRKNSDGSMDNSGLPGPTAVAAGFNDRYVTLAVDPVESEGEARSARRFFYIDRTVHEAMPFAKDAVSGPLDANAFAREKARLSLPEFTWFNDGL